MLVYEATGNNYKHYSRNVMMRIFVAIEIENDEIVELMLNLSNQEIFILHYNLLVKFQRK